MQDEADAVRARYARRKPDDARYSVFDPAAFAALQERQRATLRLLARHRLTDLASLRLLDIGCGGGGHLLEFLRFGFAPHHLAGIELLPERHAQALACLPATIDLRLGDAATTDFGAGVFDIVHQSTVFTSLLDDAYQQRLADAMWRAVRPGGGVLWYDFTVDNPRNPDVRGVPLRRVRALFPEGRFDHRRVTLAPPLARGVTRCHPTLYAWVNAVPFLQTHTLAWIGKPN